AEELPERRRSCRVAVGGALCIRKVEQHESRARLRERNRFEQCYRLLGASGIQSGNALSKGRNWLNRDGDEGNQGEEVHRHGPFDTGAAEKFRSSSLMIAVTIAGG